MEHIQHHHPNSLLVNWLFLLLALMIERLYRERYLHRGIHPVLTAMQLKDTLWLNLRPAHADSSETLPRPRQGAAPIFDNPALPAKQNQAATAITVFRRD